jgi:hypothetical protein
VQTSEQQFEELLAHLTVRATKALAQQHQVPPMSFLLRASGEVDVAVGVADSPLTLKDMLNAMQSSLRQQVIASDVLASCVAYSEPGAGAVIALLENHENFCARVRILVAHGPRLKLNTEDMQVEDGSIYVFPIASDS